MQDRTFDRLSRAFAEQTTRRGFLGGLGALVAAGFATTAFGQKRSFNRQFAAAGDNSEEQSILLFEEFGRIAHEHDGTCDEMAAKTRAFQDQHADAIERMRIDQAAWPDDRLARHADTYGERRLVVVDRVNAAYERCQALNPGGATGTPVGTPIVAPLATPQASPAADRDNGDRLGFLQDTASCSESHFNFLVEAYCHWNGWSSPTFQWPAYCPMDVIDSSCALCPTKDFKGYDAATFCMQFWHEQCADSNGDMQCELHFNHGGGGVAAADCTQLKETHSPVSRCYSRETSWHSPTFQWPAVCPHTVVDHECILCADDYGGHHNPEFCEQTWPQDCHSDSRGNICYIGWHVPEGTTCCEKNCPISTVGCALHVFASFTGDYHCAGCLSSWCGSTDRCLEDCKANDCCDGACGESDSGLPFDDGDDDDTTDFPGGEGRRGGTPIPIGTPDVAPTVVPPPAVPTEAPPPAVPTEAPSTPSIATPLT